MPINRTILELKLPDDGASVNKDLTINRTILELKPIDNINKQIAFTLLIEPFWN